MTDNLIEMQILLANAKIMFDKSEREPLTEPMFQKQAEAMAAEMAMLDVEELSRLLGCNRAIAAENLIRYRNFRFADKMPALLAYNGQAYKHLRAATLSDEALAFGQKHLWITCFLYGLLRPMDGIVPYRMEHTARLDCTDGKPVDRYWKDKLTDVLIDSVKADDGILVHLSTGEYEHLFDWKRVCRETTVIQPLFYVRTGGRLKMQAVWAKSCRGVMTGMILQQRLDSPEALMAFRHEGFEYNPAIGEPRYPHFVREEQGRTEIGG